MLRDPFAGTMAASLRRQTGGKVAAVVALLAAAATVGACTQLGTLAPSHFDLSGEWVLDRQASDQAPDLDAIRDREDRELVRGRPASAADSAAFVVQDFPVLAARRLRIEQHADSMGVSYDGRQYRDVSWGDRIRDLWAVRAGWADGQLVVRTERGPIRGEEVFALENGGRRLRVAVSVHAGDEHVRALRVFRRP